MQQRLDPPTPAGSAGPSARPPLLARLAAVAAIVFAGICGGLIGYSVVDLSCSESCPTKAGLSGVLLAVLAALGVAIVAVLVLRAMGEWKTGGKRATPQSQDNAPRG